MPSIASDFLLGRLQATASQWLNETCVIEVNVPAISEDLGSESPQWQVLASSVPCRVIGANDSKYGAVGMQQALEDTYRIALPPPTGVYTWSLVTGMRITVGSKTYSVTGIEDDLSNGIFRHAVVKRIRV